MRYDAEYYDCLSDRLLTIVCGEYDGTVRAWALDSLIAVQNVRDVLTSNSDLWQQSGFLRGYHTRAIGDRRLNAARVYRRAIRRIERQQEDSLARCR